MENKKSPIIVDTEAGKTYAFCTCKQSANFPFCDGKHLNSGYTPLIQTMTQSGRVAVCACGQSDNVFCNGNHKNITQ